MRETSNIYKEIVRGQYYTETRLSVDGTPPDNSIQDKSIFHLETMRRIFPKEWPSVGGCVSGEISAEFFMPEDKIPKMAKLIPYVRVKSLDGSKVSEWLAKGVFYIDTRKIRKWNDGRKIISVAGFDAMLKTEQDYPDSGLNWPAKDIDVVREICAALDIGIDDRTIAIMNKGYKIQYPAGYSCREILGYIAAMYGGNFIMSDVGKLLLCQITGVPKVPRYLINEDENVITLGGVTILV